LSTPLAFYAATLLTRLALKTLKTRARPRSLRCGVTCSRCAVQCTGQSSKDRQDCCNNDGSYHPLISTRTPHTYSISFFHHGEATKPAPYLSRHGISVLPADLLHYEKTKAPATRKAGFRTRACCGETVLDGSCPLASVRFDFPVEIALLFVQSRLEYECFNMTEFKEFQWRDSRCRRSISSTLAGSHRILW